MKKMSLLLFAGTTMLCLVVAAPSQMSDRGALNTWTTRVVERRHETAETAYTAYLKGVRAERHNGFDRAIFEFQGPLPNYNIKYFATPYYVNEDESKERIRIAGNAFIQAAFYFIRNDETQNALSGAPNFFPTGKLKMPALRQMTDRGVWEGGYDFVLGIKARQPFRVIELANPSRVVIDVRH